VAERVLAPPRAVAFCRTVGGTPLVELTRLAPHPQVRMFAKLEWFNPTGSVKDRVACAMLDAAAEAGELWPGRRILEPSSGNTGIALAMQGRLRGFDVSIVMPAGSTPEREQLMRLFGADVIYSPAELGSNGAVAMARELSEADPTLYMPFQYGNAANPRAHERGTAEEILAACPEVDVFVAGLGTGGTLMGCARRLRRDRPELQVVAAEPLPGEGIDGLRSLEDGYTPEILDLSLLDRKLLVSNEDSVRGLRALAREEGLFAGVSSGGVLHAALRVARDLDGPANIVMVLADGGWKYLSAGLWDTPEAELLERMEQGVWW
jgi:[CysO sulfur-carrier protein]-thiocarboxylate-dependent cysteine synthase